MTDSQWPARASPIMNVFHLSHPGSRTSQPTLYPGVLSGPLKPSSSERVKVQIRYLEGVPQQALTGKYGDVPFPSTENGCTMPKDDVALLVGTVLNTIPSITGCKCTLCYRASGLSI